MFAAVAFLLAAGSAVATACSDPGPISEYRPPLVTTDLGDASTSTADAPILLGSDTEPPCVNLQCKQKKDCPAGGTTSLSGKVLDPSGKIPLYNALVYVPNAAVDVFKPGIACDRCASVPSGRPIAVTLTDAKGEFVLKNVPVDVNVPVVVQIGRWRRQVTVPTVAACKDTPLDAEVTRLPRSKAEGDIPQIAISTGGADAIECFFRKLGIAPAEFTNPSGPGRVHLYQGKRTDPFGTVVDGSKIDNATPTGKALWDSLDELKKHDIVVLSCEGDENDGPTGTMSAAAKQNIFDYVNAGGRVFASHYHYTWIKKGIAPLPTTANWVPNVDEGDRTVTVDQSFPRGQALAEWLQNVGATATPGKIAMIDLRKNVASVNPAVSRQWIHDPGVSTKYFSFNTPIGKPVAEQCGRTVYTDIHVSSGDIAGGTFPANCVTGGLFPQEKALLFLIMDLASCIGDDGKPPEPPPLPK